MTTSDLIYYGHTHRLGRTHWQTMKSHASGVSARAAAFASAFGQSEQAELAGDLHDLGKHGDLFQRRLENPSLQKGLDHWSAGAAAARKLNDAQVALCIYGHHIGLQTREALARVADLKLLDQDHPQQLQLSETDLALLMSRADGLPKTHWRALKQKVPSRDDSAAGMLDTRMLFSALVDADYLDTEAAMKMPRDPARPSGPPLQAEKALATLKAHVSALGQGGNLPAATAKLRALLAEACAEAGLADDRRWTLTAPTGSGKTLSMLLFALTRAARDPRIRRIVVVLPYLSILDQTVDTYRKVFPEKTFSDGYILEHHSLAGTHNSEEQSRVARALTQNWDAPIIITTSVQLLESLHAAHPGTCRKLHRLAGSVVMLDEIQTLPAKLAVTTLKTLSRLASDRYGSVVVLATATQPAFEALDAQVTAGEPGDAGWAPREIVPAQAQLYTLARRVKVNWHLENPTSWDDVAAWTEKRERVMTIVNLKAHAALLIERLRGTPGLAHVSTSLCPAHRRVVLQDVRYRMSGSGPCRVVATQCLEAGVELDFPLVIRAVAPYDAVTQAGGRCNRHGLLLFGELRVFLPEDERYPGDGQRRGREQKGQYNRGAQMTRALQREAELAGTELDLDDPATFHRYYRRLLQYTSADDRTLQDAIRRHDFPLVAEHYRLIDQGAVNVVVPYGEGVHLIDEALHEGIDAGWIRRAQPYSVSVFQRRNNALPDFCAEVSVRETGSQNGLRRLETAEQWRVCVQPDAYDSSLMGLRQSDHPDSLTD